MRLDAKWTALDIAHTRGAKFLADDYQANTIFSTRPWISASLNHLMAHRKPILLQFDTADSKTHYFAFSIGWERIGGLAARTLRLAGYPYLDRLVFNQQANIIDGLIASIAHLTEPWDIVILDEIVSDDLPHFRRAVASLPKKYWTRCRYCSHTPIFTLESLKGVDVYSCYSKSLRTRIKRARKKLVQNGDVRFRRLIPGSKSELDEMLNIIAAIEGESWKGVADVGIFSRESKDFFFELSRGLSESGQLDIIILYLNERPIAYRYGFIFANTYYDYNFAQLPDFNSLSPGRILLDQVIINSVTDGLHAIDGSRGSIERPQLLCDWTGTYIDHNVFWIGNSTIPGLASKFAVNRLRPWVSRLKQFLGGKKITPVLGQGKIS